MNRRSFLSKIVGGAAAMAVYPLSKVAKSSTTTIAVASNSGLTTGQMLTCGDEAMRVTHLTPTSVTVDRGMSIVDGMGRILTLPPVHLGNGCWIAKPRPTITGPFAKMCVKWDQPEA